MEPPPETSAALEFGRFRILPQRREFLADNRPIHLGGRAFDVLMALIEASGAVVSKDALIERVWPNQIVEENNLHVQISALRNAFAADRDLIRTIAGRGYQFTGEVRAHSAGPYVQAVAGTAPSTSAPFCPPTNLPQPVSELIGRDVAFEEIMGLITLHRLVTLTGAGGIGKTRLGLEVARHLLPKFVDGVWVVELAALSDPDLVPVTIATALRLELAAGAMSPERIANALGAKQLVLLLDDCEHVVDAAARMSEALLRFSPAVCVMATSREPLQAEGEHIYRVPPLDMPAAGTPDVEDASRYGAVRLFVARARAAGPRFSPDARATSMIVAICRRLDGIPLAIELAAARAAALGIEELAARLDDRFHLLTGGRRTALPRHQTLRATLDWSYELLGAPERVLLHRLAIFAGGFRLDAATAIATSAELPASEVVDSLANLVAKSLVATDVDRAIVRYRLPETTRAYALEKLAESGELEAVARRHAEYYLDLLERGAAELATRPALEWLADYGRRTDNIRAALDWAFSPNGDASLGIALTASAVPLWVNLSLMEECHRRVERALSSLGPGSSRDLRREMQLYTGLGQSLMYTTESEAAWTNTLTIAESLKDVEYQLRALRGLCTYRISSGEYRAALELAQRFRELAANQVDPTDLLIADRMIGVAQHFLGEQTTARYHIEHMLRRYGGTAHRSQITRFHIDPPVTARVFLARILWLQGFPDQAMRTAQSNVEAAQTIDHAMTLCYALAGAACPIALFVGDLASAERFVAMLLDHSARHALPVWHAWGRGFEGVLYLKRGDVQSGLQRLRTGLGELREAKSGLRFMAFLSELAEGLGRAGQVAEGLTAIEQAIERSDATEERWSVAELLRIKGELVLLEDAPNAAAAAESHFRQAIDWAHQQEALSWELRAATSLARLWRLQARSKAARELLAPIYDRFTEGFQTADLRAARALIDELS